MQNENKPKNMLDDDILQCKMDLRNALAATRRMSKDVAVSKDTPSQSSEPIQSAQTKPAEIDAEAPVLETELPNSPIESRILPFEAIQKKQNAEIQEIKAHLTPVSDSPETPAGQPPADLTELDTLRQTIGRLEQNIEDERQKSSQLEQLAEQLRFSIADREADIRLVRNDLARQNEQLDDARRRLENSAYTIEQQRLRIDELERELAEKINELTVLRQQADETAAALTRQAELLHRAGQEKEVAEKRLEAQTAEWAKTIESLKAAQESAAHTLKQRQAELDALRQTLAEMESRLDKADLENNELLREKTELIELLHDAQRRIAQQEENAGTAFSVEDADLADEPEPYCEPAAEEICEDDVHLEQKLSNSTIPTFNLAEQIMAEQRKAAAGRRQPPQVNPAASVAAKEGIEQVMRHYISDTTSTNVPVSSAPEGDKQRGERFARWQGETLSGLQQSLLAAIVQKDIRRYCGTDCPKHGSYPAAHGRPMSN